MCVCVCVYVCVCMCVCINIYSFIHTERTLVNLEVYRHNSFIRCVKRWTSYTRDFFIIEKAYLKPAFVFG